MACLLTLGGCTSVHQGIFGSLPELYEEMAAHQRAIGVAFTEGLTDRQAARTFHRHVQAIEVLRQNVAEEALALRGRTVDAGATPSAPFEVGKGVIERVVPGTTTTVWMRFPARPRQNADPADVPLFYLDRSGEVVAKAEAAYHPSLGAIIVRVPFEPSSDGTPLPEGYFEHYADAHRLIVVSHSEYQSDSLGTVAPKALVTDLPPVDITPSDSVAPIDSAAEPTARPDTVDAGAIEAAVDNPSPSFTGPRLTQRGVDAVVLGASIMGLPDRIEGLYDSKHVEKEYDEMEEEPLLTATFIRDGKEVMSVLGDEQGNIVFITIEGSNIKVEIDGRLFGTGDTLTSLYKMKGVRRDSTGAYAATFGSISFSPTPGGRIHTITVGNVW